MNTQPAKEGRKPCLLASSPRLTRLLILLKNGEMSYNQILSEMRDIPSKSVLQWMIRGLEFEGLIERLPMRPREGVPGRGERFVRLTELGRSSFSRPNLLQGTADLSVLPGSSSHELGVLVNAAESRSQSTRALEELTRVTWLPS